MGSMTADKDLTAIIMASLPPSYRSFLQSITASARVVSKTVEPFDLVHWITEEYELQLKQTQRDKDGGTALSVKAGKGRRGKEKKKKQDVECFNCHKIRHTIAECWHPGGGKEGQGPHQKKKGSPLNTAAATTEDENFAFIATLMPEDEDDSVNEGIALRCTSEFGDVAATAPDDPDRQRDAIMDSGANRHFCPHKPLLSKFREVKRTFKTADGKVCHTLGIGELEIELPNGSESTTMTLKDVLYTPSLHFTLISIGRLDDVGCKMIFGDGTCEITSPGKQGRTIGKIPKEGNLYHLHALYSSQFADAANAVTAKLSISDLHRKMGHISHEMICHMIKSGAVTGVQLDESSKPEFCEACAKAKIKRLPVPKQRSNARAAKKYGDRIHSDLWGPAQVSSIGGKNYFITFTDKVTTVTKVEFLKKKSEVFPNYRNFAMAAKTQRGVTVKELHSGRGGEYCNEKMVEFLKRQGTKHTKSVHDTPQQDGIPERLNGTIVGNARAMLFHSQLPKFLWAEAVSHAVWLKNRSPMKALNGKTPLEAIGDGKPDLSSLHEFGATVYVRVEAKKLDARGEEAKFVGYDKERKGYRVYWPLKRLVTVERNVKFCPDEVLIPVNVQSKGEKAPRVNPAAPNIIKMTEDKDQQDRAPPQPIPQPVEHAPELI
jgi:hypothetical protein